MRKLLDGPVRARTFWTTIFAAAVLVTAEFGVDLGVYEPIVDAALTALVAVGALTGTRGTQPIPDDATKGW